MGRLLPLILLAMLIATSVGTLSATAQEIEEGEAILLTTNLYHTKAVYCSGYIVVGVQTDDGIVLASVDSLSLVVKNVVLINVHSNDRYSLLCRNGRVVLVTYNVTWSSRDLAGLVIVFDPTTLTVLSAMNYSASEGLAFYAADIDDLGNLYVVGITNVVYTVAPIYESPTPALAFGRIALEGTVDWMMSLANVHGYSYNVELGSGRLYIAVGPNLLVVDESTGAIIANRTIEMGGQYRIVDVSRLAYDPQNNVLYLAIKLDRYTALVTALDAETLTPLWTINITAPNLDVWVNDLELHNGELYIAGGLGGDGFVIAVDPDGNVEFAVKMSGLNIGDVVIGDLVYVVAYNRTFNYIVVYPFIAGVYTAMPYVERYEGFPGTLSPLVTGVAPQEVSLQGSTFSVGTKTVAYGAKDLDGKVDAVVKKIYDEDTNTLVLNAINVTVKDSDSGEVIGSGSSVAINLSRISEGLYDVLHNDQFFGQLLVVDHVAVFVNTTVIDWSYDAAQGKVALHLAEKAIVEVFAPSGHILRIDIDGVPLCYTATGCDSLRWWFASKVVFDPSVVTIYVPSTGSGGSDAGSSGSNAGSASLGGNISAVGIAVLATTLVLIAATIAARRMG